VEKEIRKFLSSIKFDESTVSTVLGALVVLITASLVINYFRTNKNQNNIVSLSPTPAQVKIIEKEGKMVPEGLPREHIVAKGEHLWAIAEKYYTSGYNWVDIARENKLKKPYVIAEGQRLVIPQVEVKTLKVSGAKSAVVAYEAISGDKYTVMRGDTLWSIAVRAYGDGFKYKEVARVNKLINPSLIHPGNELSLPR